MKTIIITLILLFLLNAGKTLAQQDTNKTNTKQTVTIEEEAFIVVEEMPEFPGGDDARVKFLLENIKYPQKERINKTEGLVIVSFIVEKDGSITNVKVLKSISPPLDAEAIRVIKSMPDWTPGKQKGKPVRVQINMPIRFSLN